MQPVIFVVSDEHDTWYKNGPLKTSGDHTCAAGSIMALVEGRR